MKTGIIYFSLEGNTKYVAEKIAKEINADLIRLVPEKEYPKGKFAKYFWCGKSALFKESPKLKNYDFDPDLYDLLLLGTPIWAGTFAPPLRTFLREHKIMGKQVSIFVTCSGGSAEKSFSQIEKEISENNIISKIKIVDPLQNLSLEDEKKILDLCEILKNKKSQ